MAYRFGNGSIVRDTSLVLLLDAADKNSYAGTGTSWSDLNNNGNVATLSGTPTFNEGNGGGLFFNGTNQYGTIGTNSTYFFGGTTPYTLSAWVRPSVVNSTQNILGRFNGGVAGNYMLKIDSSGKAVFMREVSPYDVFSTATLVAGRSYHICGVYDGTNQRIYVNGSLQPNSTASGTTAYDQSNISLLIGARQQSGSPTEYFSGSIHHVAIYNRALNSSEVSRNYNALKGRFNAQDVNVSFTNTALWDASSLTTDLSGNAITNTNVTTNTSIYTIGTQSAVFDASADKLVWPSVTTPGTQDFFIGVWARWTRYGAGNTCFITGFGNGNAANTLMIGALNPSYYSNGISLFVAGNYNSYATSFIPSENVWHHVALSRSGSTFRLFVDGTLRGTWNISGFNITSPFRIGSGWTNDGEYMNGYANSAQVVIGHPVVTSNFTITSPTYALT